MLNIVCLNAGNYLGRGVEYVNILADMVARNISKETTYKFICFTDSINHGFNYFTGKEGGLYEAPHNKYDPEIDVRPLPAEGLEGWWNKLALFKEGLFPDGDRILYIDLDSVITSGLDDIIKYDGEFAILRDFYRPEGMQSSVMAWKANGHSWIIWEAWVRNGMPKDEYGDQRWIERMVNPDYWQDLYPNCFVSYKIHAAFDIPKCAKIVVFHGEPRPHEVKDGWMPFVWKIGGGTTLELKHIGNVSQDVFMANVRNSLTLSLPWLQMQDEHEGHAVIIGGGPSLNDDLEEIKQRQLCGQVIFAVNNSYNHLAGRGIVPDAHVMIDARDKNKEFLPKTGTNPLCYYASQVHPEVFELAHKNGNNVVLFHSFFSDGIFEVIGHDSGDPLIGGGCTVGLHSIALAWALGYRNFHLYGFDSSYTDDENHAYRQPLNDSDRRIEVVMNEKKYNCAPWMATQVEDFKALAKTLIEKGCVMTVHGSGLLPDVAKLMSMPDSPDTEMVCKDGTWWPSKCVESRLNSEFTFNDISTVIAACNGKKTAIQAGGNVGIWPREFARHFEKVISFEPDELNFECMVKNTENNDNLTIYNTALGDKVGEAALVRASHNCGAHYVKDGSEFRVMTIDSLDLDSCDLIQLDIEGYEMNALKGAVETISAFHPVIMVEDKGLSQRYGTCKGDIEKWLEPMGYIQHAVTGRDVIFVHKQ